MVGSQIIITMNFVTATEAARILKVHPGHALKLLDRERISYERVGKARAYHIADVNKLAARRMLARFRRRNNV